MLRVGALVCAWRSGSLRVLNYGAAKSGAHTMATDLPSKPPVPAGLREAAGIRKMIPFIGAGASRLAGGPGWDEFADGVLRQLVAQGKFTCAELDQVKGLTPRMKLSIAKTLANDRGTQIDFKALLHPALSAGDRDKGQKLYGSLFKLGNVFVTTNYDLWLDERIPDPPLDGAPAADQPGPATRMRSIFRVDEFLPSVLDQANTVVHLHGSVDEPGGMVLSTLDYVTRYANDRGARNASEENRVLTFLEKLFGGRYTVLFIGYGLEELEILEYVALKARLQKRVAPGEVRHFLLQGFFSHEAVLRQRLDTYYREFGIGLVAFQQDRKGHEQLLEVLEGFAQQIPAAAPLVLGQEQTLEDLAVDMEPLQ